MEPIFTPLMRHSVVPMDISNIKTLFVIIFILIVTKKYQQVLFLNSNSSKQLKRKVIKMISKVAHFTYLQ